MSVEFNGDHKTALKDDVKSGHHQFLGYYQLYYSGVCLSVCHLALRPNDYMMGGFQQSLTSIFMLLNKCMIDCSLTFSYLWIPKCSIVVALFNMKHRSSEQIYVYLYIVCYVFVYL